MTRQEVYEKCVRVLEKHKGYSISEVMLPKDAVDAIIDRAVQESVYAVGKEVVNALKNAGLLEVQE